MRAVARYLRFTSISMRQAIANRGQFIGQAILYVIILLIFSRLWTVAFESNPDLAMGMSSTDMLWYVAVTEWILLSMPYMHLEIEKDVRSGDIAYFLTRPVSYIYMKMMEGLGRLLVAFVVLGCVGVLSGLFLTGSLPKAPLVLVALIPIGMVASFIGMIFLLCVGLSAFWIQDTSPLFWVWQKLLFILGGLILPLSLYPAWLRELASYTPFPSLLFGPASLAVAFDSSLVEKQIAGLFLWGGVSVAILSITYSLGRKRLQINGG